jgi:cell division protein FtsB
LSKREQTGEPTGAPVKFLEQEKRLRAQHSELQQLRAEVLALRAQNESMRSGMRRCISCEYRLEVKERNPQT